MPFPPTISFIWVGTNASIPSGWERDTTMDGVYPKGSAPSTEPNTTGGSATHSHTSSAHSHTQNTHTHSVSLNTCNGNPENDEDPKNILVHGHAAVTSSNSSGGNLSSVESTYASLANDPPYYKVIWIKPTAIRYGLPNLGVYLYDGTDSRTNHYICDGNNSTPNLANKYLLGAGAGADAGATGGSVTNVHALTHTHTVAAHSHAAFNSAVPNLTTKMDWWGGSSGGVSNTTHVHSITLNNATGTLTGSISLTTTETVQPAYTALLAVQNRTGNADIRYGMIGAYKGALASIPAHWKLMDGTGGTTDMRSRHLAITPTVGSIGSTGGSNTHTHASQAHTHTGVAHTHTASNVDHAAFSDPGGGYQAAGAYTTTHYNSVHAVSCGSATSVYANANTTANSSANEPPYRTVVFVKFQGPVVEGLLLSML